MSNHDDNGEVDNDYVHWDEVMLTIDRTSLSLNRVGDGDLRMGHCWGVSVHSLFSLSFLPFVSIGMRPGFFFFFLVLFLSFIFTFTFFHSFCSIPHLFFLISCPHPIMPICCLTVDGRHKDGMLC
ncbi:uncharacterized protein LDX57_002697 [Aspergillus melleus]|uniref:uncharacterized protein n=1 Tax=Aspergillus melleus TaxID=138277 RepID=UPI001E8E6AD4|nr:uncharacterized protein LDX57_002697 [Aspergillus melleus]KAH8424951.1 hypothetical protein LDX57_002697 [Aspergillus melleus]